MLRVRYSTGFCHCCLWMILSKLWESEKQMPLHWSHCPRPAFQSEHLVLPFFCLLPLGSCLLFRSVWPSDSFRAITFYIVSYRFGEDSHSGNRTQTFLCLGSKWLLQTFSIEHTMKKVNTLLLGEQLQWRHLLFTSHAAVHTNILSYFFWQKQIRLVRLQKESVFFLKDLLLFYGYACFVWMHVHHIGCVQCLRGPKDWIGSSWIRNYKCLWKLCGFYKCTGSSGRAASGLTHSAISPTPFCV